MQIGKEIQYSHGRKCAIVEVNCHSWDPDVEIFKLEIPVNWEGQIYKEWAP